MTFDDAIARLYTMNQEQDNMEIIIPTLGRQSNFKVLYTYNANPKSLIIKTILDRSTFKINEELWDVVLTRYNNLSENNRVVTGNYGDKWINRPTIADRYVSPYIAGLIHYLEEDGSIPEPHINKENNKDMLEEKIRRIELEIEDNKNKLSNSIDIIRRTSQNTIEKLKRSLSELYQQLDKERFNKTVTQLQELINDFISNNIEQEDRNEFINRIEFNTNDDNIIVNIRKDDEQPNNKEKGILRVAIGDKVIKNKINTRTFVEAIRELGIEEVRNLGITMYRGIPLISETDNDCYNTRQIADNRYLLTQMSNVRMKEILEEIGDRLGKQISVYID